MNWREQAVQNVLESYILVISMLPGRRGHWKILRSIAGSMPSLSDSWHRVFLPFSAGRESELRRFAAGQDEPSPISGDLYSDAADVNLHS